MSVKNIELYKRVLEAEKKKDAVIEGSFKRFQQPGLRYHDEGTDQDTHNMHRQQQTLNLGRQRAYSGVRTLPIEGHADKTDVYFGRKRTFMEVMRRFR